MGGPNLEVFKFGMYIMFPIGIMYYFGTNLDSRFAVPDFWPKPSQTHTIPFEREEISEELERLKQRRLAARARRLELAGQPTSESSGGEGGMGDAVQRSRSNEGMEEVRIQESSQSAERREGGSGKGWLGWLR